MNGVPQGSILSPFLFPYKEYIPSQFLILFNIYINDLPDITDNKLFLIADTVL